MGIEYRIKLPSGYEEEFESFLRQTRFFQSFDPKFSVFNLRASGPEKKEDFPDAYVSCGADGIVFCDNLTSRKDAAAIFLDLIDYALRKYDRAIVEET
jgi:hypothetical protein